MKIEVSEVNRAVKVFYVDEETIPQVEVPGGWSFRFHLINEESVKLMNKLVSAYGVDVVRDNKIRTIKLLREMKDLTLVEAKDAYETVIPSTHY